MERDRAFLTDSTEAPDRRRNDWLWRLVPPVAIAVFLALALLQALGAVGRAVAIFILGITLANALAPATSRLAGLMPRTLAAVLTFLALLAIIALAGYFIFPPLAQQSTEFAEELPGYLETVRERINAFVPGGDIGDRVGSVWNTLGGYVVDLGQQVASLLIAIVLILFLAFYWLLAMPATDRFIRSLFPRERAERVSEVSDKMGHAMGGYVRGTIIDALITSTLTYIALRWIIGLEPALPLAGLMFIGEFVPYIGPFAAAVPGVLVALTLGVDTALWTALAYFVVQQIEGQILIPNIMRQAVSIPQWLVLMAVLVGGLVGGILGILAAIPLTGALNVLIEEWAAPAVRRWTGVKNRPVQPE